MYNELKITILTDKSSWMNKYNLLLKKELLARKHKVEIVHCKDEIKIGDIAFFLSCFEIVGKEYLKKNQHNIVVHASDLPNGKGWSPATWQILENKNIIPITLFEADEKCDDGDYYIKDNLLLDGDELISKWQEKLGVKIVEICLKYVDNYQNLKPIKQVGKSTFYKKRTPKDSKLDIDKTIREQFNLLRVSDNKKYPTFFEFKNKKYIIHIYEDSNE